MLALDVHEAGGFERVKRAGLAVLGDAQVVHQRAWKPDAGLARQRRPVMDGEEHRERPAGSRAAAAMSGIGIGPFRNLPARRRRAVTIAAVSTSTTRMPSSALERYF